MVRANRYALAAAQGGVALEPSVRALHGCDNTVCVRVSRPGETGLLHVVGGSQRRPAGEQLLAGRIRNARLITVQAGHDLQKPGPAAIAALLVELFLDSETSMTG
jgi:hypothetical protein